VLKFIKKLFMGFSAGNLITPNKVEKVTNPNELNTQELELLLILLRNTSFKGEQLELLYNLVIKIQNQHIEKSK
jgi:hypothetical protein